MLFDLFQIADKSVTMATVLRVKRRYDDEPFDALVIAGKRRKTDAGQSAESTAETPLTAVVKFAGTLKSQVRINIPSSNSGFAINFTEESIFFQDDDVVEHLNKTLSKDDLKANYKQRVVDVVSKTRLKTQQESRENRYKVVNYIRSIGTGTETDDHESNMTVIDVEDLAAADAAAVAAEKVSRYLAWVAKVRCVKLCYVYQIEVRHDLQSFHECGVERKLYIVLYISYIN